MKKLPLVLLLVILTLSGCADGGAAQPAPEPEPSVSVTPTRTPEQFALPYYPGTSLHPITGTNRSDLILASLTCQGLFELDNTFSASPVLCSESSVSEDGLVWTFTLGAHTFSNGSPVTAADVVSSLELARVRGLYAARLSGIRRIAAGEDGTVIITLSAPNSLLPCLLDVPIIRESGDGSMPLGTGPYYFVEDDGPLRLSRRDDAPATAPEEIALVPIEAADDLIYAFDCGSVSLVVSDLTGSNALGYSSGCEEFSYPTTSMLYVGFQTGSGFCRNAAVRQAISRCFDRSAVTGSLLAGHAAETALPFSPHCALYRADREPAPAYADDAAILFTQAGCTIGENGRLYLGRAPLSLTFIVNTDNSFKLAVAEHLAQQLTELGVTVELEKLPWDDYTKALEAGDFDLYLAEVALTADFDLTALLTRDGALNYGAFSGRELEARLLELRAAPDEQREQAAAAFLEQFLTDAPFAPLCFKDHAVLTRWGSVSGLRPTRQNPFYDLENLRFGAVN